MYDIRTRQESGFLGLNERKEEKVQPWVFTISSSTAAAHLTKSAGRSLPAATPHALSVRPFRPPSSFPPSLLPALSTTLGDFSLFSSDLVNSLTKKCTRTSTKAHGTPPRPRSPPQRNHSASVISPMRRVQHLHPTGCGAVLGFAS